MKVRYDTKDENGETRRERNERHGVVSPEQNIPEAGAYLWQWYEDLADGTARVSKGVCNPIGWADMKAWSDIMQIQVYPAEFSILRAMDRKYCEMMNIEFANYRIREDERQKNKSKRGK